MYKYLVMAALLLAAELVYFKIADHYNIIDKPNLRSSHKYITLRGGGVIFTVAMILYTALFGVGYWWFLTGLVVIAAVSFIDDIHSIPNRYRILVQFGAMLLMFCQWGVYNESQWWIIILALIFCTGVINAFNFMDGINGMTGGYSFVVLLSLLAVNALTPVVEQSLIIVSLISIVIFSLFNFRKRAKCFAGDVGAIGIAFIILFIGGALSIANGTLWYIVFLAMYGVDTILTIIHRILLHENIFEAHRKHAYQIMANELHIPQVAVSLIYMALQALISAGAIWLPCNKWIYTGVIIAVLSICYILFMKKYYHLHAEYLKQELKTNK